MWASKNCGCASRIDVGKVVFDSEHIELLITMAPAITERCSVCNIGDGLYEVTVPGITKFDGMRAVWSTLRERGVRIGTVYGFGDSENDGSMLSAVDVAVAMGNALPAVRASADYVTYPRGMMALPPRRRPLASCRVGSAGPRGVRISPNNAWRVQKPPAKGPFIRLVLRRSRGRALRVP